MCLFFIPVLFTLLQKCKESAPKKQRIKHTSLIYFHYSRKPINSRRKVKWIKRLTKKSYSWKSWSCKVKLMHFQGMKSFYFCMLTISCLFLLIFFTRCRPGLAKKRTNNKTMKTKPKRRSSASEYLVMEMWSKHDRRINFLLHYASWMAASHYQQTVCEYRTTKILM